MKYLHFETQAGREETLAFLRDDEQVNRNVRFEGEPPAIRLTEKGDRIRIRCEYRGGATKDNGFLVGTYFTGKLTEKDGVTTLRGFLFTAPIYHLVLFALFVFFIVQCIVRRGFSVIPILLVIFDVFLFYKEFRKQGIIARYLARAFRKLNEKNRQDPE